MRGIAWLGLCFGLLCCTSTYTPEELKEEEAETPPPCDVLDTRPGCQAENPSCMEADNYLCDP